MFLVDNPSRTISVKQVDGQEESLGYQSERVVSFNQEVNEIWTHEPLDLRLDVDCGNVGQCFALNMSVSMNVIKSRVSRRLTSIVSMCCKTSSRYSQLVT